MLRHFLITGKKSSQEIFSHGYYQGLLVEIGKMHKFKTYIPAQDKNRIFLDNVLGNIADATSIPPFSYPDLVKRAKTVDVIWFNERRMPCSLFEVEHTTDIKSSLEKFYELQDFNTKFAIVADKSRKKQFDDIIERSIFSPIKNRVVFINYDRVAAKYNGLKTEIAADW